MKTYPCNIQRPFSAVKSKKFYQKKFDSLNILPQNIDCGYTLGGSNEYPQSVFWSKNKKYWYTPANPSFFI